MDTSRLRSAGYRKALEDAGLSADRGLVQQVDRLGMREGAERVREMARSGLDFDGVFCVTDSPAMGVLRGLADVGTRVPDRVKVIRFDNVSQSEFFIPSLSSVDPHHDDMAERAVDLLVRRIEQTEPPAPHQDVVGGFSLVVRESTGGRPSPEPQAAPQWL